MASGGLKSSHGLCHPFDGIPMGVRARHGDPWGANTCELCYQTKKSHACLHAQTNSFLMCVYNSGTEHVWEIATTEDASSGLRVPGAMCFINCGTATQF